MNIELRPCVNQSSRGGVDPCLFVLHIADGFVNGMLSQFNTPSAEVSSTFIIGKDGQTICTVPVDRRPWTNGKINKATSKIVQQKGGNPNAYSVTVEFEGFYNDHPSYKNGANPQYKGTQGKLTEAQISAVVNAFKWTNEQLKASGKPEIPATRDHIIGHYEIDGVSRSLCGFNFPYDEIIKRIKGNSVNEQITTDKIWRVQTGAFKSKENAENYVNTLKNQGVDCFIV